MNQSADAIATPQARAIAFYLPQFHPVPENDAWWGRGFTEWTNVARARPQFPGHYQPHLPADLGFYDLRVPEVRDLQATLARNHGIHGFCYYHYWFNGRRILERPVNDMLASGTPDFPFCLCWANENWTRRWDGADSEVLLEQRYSEEDDRAHIRSLLPAFSDSRYIRVDGRPLFLVYRTSNLPEPARTAQTWREEARRLGVGELFLCAVESFWTEHGEAVRAEFNAAVEFAPDWRVLPSARRSANAFRVMTSLWRRPAALLEHRVYRYADLAGQMLAKPAPPYLRFPGVTPMWDNSARRKKEAVIFVGSQPKVYGEWLAENVRRLQARPSEERIVFLNAWNEWGEGSHLEPCQKWGLRYLAATRSALCGATTAAAFSPGARARTGSPR